MNNNQDNLFPDVPAAFNDWHIYTALYDCTTDFGVTDTAKNRYRLQRRVLLHQMKLMSNTKCAACSGYGHRARDCPTNSRVSLLGSTGLEAKKLIAYARC